jgi:flagellar biosynthesis component FlhA
LSWKRATQSTSAIPSAFGSSGTLGSNPSLPSSVFAPISTTLVASPQLPPEEEVEEDSDVEKEEEAVGEEEADQEEEEVMKKKERNPAQISTLEVLGQDSDARRKRFESSLPNNRYLEVSYQSLSLPLRT